MLLPGIIFIHSSQRGIYSTGSQRSVGIVTWTFSNCKNVHANFGQLNCCTKASTTGPNYQHTSRDLLFFNVIYPHIIKIMNAAGHESNELSEWFQCIYAIDYELLTAGSISNSCPDRTFHESGRTIARCPTNLKQTNFHARG